MKKRGMGNIIVAVLLVLVVIVAIAVVWNVVLSIVRDGGLSVADADVSVVTSEGYTVYDPDTKLASVQIKRGDDNVNVRNIEVIFSVAGDSVKFVINKSDVLSPNSMKLYKFNFEGKGVPESVRVVPLFGLRIGSVTGNVVATGNVIGGGELRRGSVDLSGTVYDLDEDGNTVVFGSVITGDVDVDSDVSEVTCNDADFDNSGSVDFNDFTFFSADYGRADCDFNNNYCDELDLDKSGKVDFNDFTFFSSFYGQECSPLISCDIYISDCQELNQEGKNYCLEKGVSINSGNCFDVTADNIGLDCKEFEITTGMSGVGVMIDEMNGATIKNCKIKENFVGVYFIDSSNNLVEGNNFNSGFVGVLFEKGAENNVVRGNEISLNQDSAILFISGHGDVVNNNKIIDNRMESNANSGVQFIGPGRSSDIVVDGNTILSHNNKGVDIRGADSIEVKNNVVRDNVGGMVFLYSNNIVIQDNIVEFNRGEGIGVVGSRRNVIRDNVVEFNRGEGIGVENSEENEITGNKVNSNRGGLSIKGATDTLIENNIANSNSDYWGISVENSLNIRLIRNVLGNNGGGEDLIGVKSGGVYVGLSSGGSILDNRIFSNEEYGIFLLESSDFSFENNEISGSEVYDVFCNDISDVDYLSNDHGIMNNCPREWNTCLDSTYCGVGSICVDGFCESEFVPRCEPFFDADWSFGSDVLANGVFDRTGPIQRSLNWDASDYLEVVQNNADYVLKADSIKDNNCNMNNEHCFERVVVEDFDEPLEIWGGTTYINPKDFVSYNDPTSLAFLGAYENSWSPWRLLTMKTCRRVSAKRNSAAYIVFSGGWITNPNFAGCNYEEDGFFISDAEHENFNDAWPDRWIRVDWFLTRSHELYTRVDDGDWRKIWAMGPYNNYKRLDLGWVSSYSNGDMKYKGLELYNKECVPEWVLEN